MPAPVCQKAKHADRAEFHAVDMAGQSPGYENALTVGEAANRASTQTPPLVLRCCAAKRVVLEEGNMDVFIVRLPKCALALDTGRCDGSPCVANLHPGGGFEELAKPTSI